MSTTNFSDVFPKNVWCLTVEGGGEGRGQDELVRQKGAGRRKELGAVHFITLPQIYI